MLCPRDKDTRHDPILSVDYSEWNIRNNDLESLLVIYQELIHLKSIAELLKYTNYSSTSWQVPNI